MERQTVVTTLRLQVTTWVPGDADDLYRLHLDPQTMQFVGHGRPKGRQECGDRLTSYLYEQRVRGWTKWRVQTTAGAMIGRAGSGASGSTRELGYTSRRSCWGRGLATELAYALVQWHADHPEPHGPSDLWAYADSENSASRRVLGKVGFDFIDCRDHHGTTSAFDVYGSRPPSTEPEMGRSPAHSSED